MRRVVVPSAGLMLAVAAAQTLTEREPVERIEVKDAEPFGYDMPRLLKRGPQRDWEQHAKPKHRKRKRS